MEWFIVVPLWIAAYVAVGGISAFFDVRYLFRKAMRENDNALCEDVDYVSGKKKVNSKEKQIELNLKAASKDWGAWLVLWPIGYLEYLYDGIGYLIKQGVAGKAIKEAEVEAEEKRIAQLTAKYEREALEKFDKELEGKGDA
jgi:hypothetical protein